MFARTAALWACYVTQSFARVQMASPSFLELLRSPDRAPAEPAPAAETELESLLAEDEAEEDEEHILTLLAAAVDPQTAEKWKAAVLGLFRESRLTGAQRKMLAKFFVVAAVSVRGARTRADADAEARIVEMRERFVGLLGRLRGAGPIGDETRQEVTSTLDAFLQEVGWEKQGKTTDQGEKAEKETSRARSERRTRPVGPGLFRAKTQPATVPTSIPSALVRCEPSTGRRSLAQTIGLMAASLGLATAVIVPSFLVWASEVRWVGVGLLAAVCVVYARSQVLHAARRAVTWGIVRSRIATMTSAG